jgi:hypothetical protein
MSYVRIRSWHRVAPVSRGGLPKTRCGRWADLAAPVSDELPIGEKSCETCLRLHARDEETA